MSGQGVNAGRSLVAAWLLVLTGMVAVMVLLGGLTRLTGSGLSMVEWQPLTLLPPLSEAAWQDAFAKYRASPQYQLINAGMTLEGFCGIFWLEYIHRLWGRLIGVVFLLPFIGFVARGWITRSQIPRMALLFALGGAQGLLGWLMVKSGLAARPEVSHLHLAAHLLAALLIEGALLWAALDWLRRGPGQAAVVPLNRHLLALLALVGVTIGAGALVAGLHAGLIYNTVPLMDGRLIPAEAFELSPLWRNAFDNVALVQFDHRLLALLTWAAAVGLWLSACRRSLPPRLRLALALVPLAASLQVGLGVATLLLVVPLPLAAAHQAGAFLLFSVTLWAAHEAAAG
jgi:cytochrome c oxidase assembly protein subunit 15